MEHEHAKKILRALNRKPPKGWTAQGLVIRHTELGPLHELDYVNAKGKHKTYGMDEIEGGVRIIGGRSGPVDVMFD